MQKEIEAFAKEFFSNNKIDIDKDSYYKDFYLSLSEIKSYSIDIYNLIINNPTETLEVIDRVFSELIGVENIRIRLVDFDKEVEETKIRDLRAKDIGKLVFLKGYNVTQSDVRPQISRTRFECQDCGTIIVVSQNEKVIREPTACSCGNRKNLIFKSNELVDCQRIVIAEEDGEYEQNGSPKLAVFLSEGLTNPEQKIFENIGKKVSVLGILRGVEVMVGIGKISTRLDLAIEANNFLFE